MPLSWCSPLSTNSMPEPATKSFTVVETGTSPGAASGSMRAATCTVRPARSSPRISHSPVCSPARTSMPSSRAAWVIDVAQAIARPGPSKHAVKPSPVVLISRPRNRRSCFSSRANADPRSSNASPWPGTSTNCAHAGPIWESCRDLQRRRRASLRCARYRRPPLRTGAMGFPSTELSRHACGDTGEVKVRLPTNHTMTQSRGPR